MSDEVGVAPDEDKHAARVLPEVQAPDDPHLHEPLEQRFERGAAHAKPVPHKQDPPRQVSVFPLHVIPLQGSEN